MKKYCCENFQYRAETDREMGLNIRIVKITEDLALDPENLKNPYRIFITDGYDLDSSTRSKIALIYYCPFCGKKLSKLYRSDVYLNETPENLIKY